MTPPTVDHRGPASVQSGVVGLLMRPAMSWALGAMTRSGFSPEMLAWAAWFDTLGRWWPLPRGTRVEPTSVGGVAAEWVRGPGAAASRRRAVVYFHGGGWCFGGLNSHRALVARVSAAARVPVLSVDYRMVPEVELLEEIDDCLDAYAGLLADGRRGGDLVLMGDSAGGHLAVATALRARDRGIPLPAGVVVLSGCLDLDLAAHEVGGRGPVDPLGALGALGALVAGVAHGLDVADPAVSPINADLAGLPPVMLVVGSADVVAADARRMAARLGAAGVETVLQIWDRQGHVFQAFAPMVPEAVTSLVDIGAAVRRLLRGEGLADAPVPRRGAVA